MSFSANIKKELAQIVPEENHCKMAEFVALMSGLGRIYTKPQEESIQFTTENVVVAKKILKLIKELFFIKVELEVRKQGHSHHNYQYVIVLSKLSDIQKVLDETKILETSKWERQIIDRPCCQRAFVRGIFLAAGSMSAPEKAYHFEVVCRNQEQATYLQNILHGFDVEASVVLRKNKMIVYLKDSTAIIDTLNVMGAHQSLMEMENVRILKGMRNSANRQYNCDSANINKMVKAAGKQIEDIHLLEKAGVMKELSSALYEMATVRLEYPDASIQELGAYLDPPIGKSGVNHRLRKLSKLAEDLREKGV